MVAVGHSGGSLCCAAVLCGMNGMVALDHTGIVVPLVMDHRIHLHEGTRDGAEPQKVNIRAHLGAFGSGQGEID